MSFDHLPPSPSDIRKVLDRAIERLGTEASWCQNVACVKAGGEPCEPFDLLAARWGPTAHLLVAEKEMLPASPHHQYPVWNVVNRRAGGFAELNHIGDQEGREAVVKALEELRETLCPAPVRRNGR